MQWACQFLSNVHSLKNSICIFSYFYIFLSIFLQFCPLIFLYLFFFFYIFILIRLEWACQLLSTVLSPSQLYICIPSYFDILILLFSICWYIFSEQSELASSYQPPIHQLWSDLPLKQVKLFFSNTFLDSCFFWTPLGISSYQPCLVPSPEKIISNDHV